MTHRCRLALFSFALFLVVAASGSWAGTSLVVNRMVMVSAAGTPVENCQGLLDALAAITDASASNTYLLKLEPGHYDCQDALVGMKEFVSIEGSGRAVTRIEGDGTVPTIVGSPNNELRHVTVESAAGAGSTALAMIIGGDGDSPRIAHVDFKASGPDNVIALFINSGGSPELHDVRVTATGGTGPIGIALLTAAPILDGVHVVVSGAATGVGITSTADDPTPGGEHLVIRNSTIAVNATSDARGIEFFEISDAPRLTNLDVRAGLAGTTYAIFNRESNLEIRRSYLGASGFAVAPTAGGTNWGLYNDGDVGSFVVEIENSEIDADQTVRNPAAFTTRIASTRIDGALVDDGGTFACLYLWSDSFASVSCP